MNKNLWIVANWKSNKNVKEALDWLDFVGPKLQRLDNLKVVVCPGFTELDEVKKAVLVGNYPMLVGSQDLSPYGVGAYTGEEPAQNLRGIADLSILGHSERRTNFGETDEQVAKKVSLAIEAGILPLVCVQGSKTPIPPNCKLVAFEPIFAIGTGNPDTPQNADSVASQLIQKSPGVEVLYGGSVSSGNVKGFIEQSHISGVLVGGASLKPDEFVAIINNSI